MTVGDLVERIFRDYLTAPGDTPTQTKIVQAVSQGAPTVVYSADLELEEVDLLSLGAVVEMDIELMRITAHNEDTRQLTWDRGYGNSTDAAHPAGTLLRVEPKPSRFMVFEALADAIESLPRSLYTVGIEWGDPRDNLVELTTADNAVQVLSATQLVAGEPMPVTARIHRSDVEFGSGVGIYYEPRNSSEDVTIRYTKRPIRPTALTDTLDALGVDTSWQRILMYDVLSAFLISPDIDATTQEFITESLASQGFPATTGVDLSVALVRLRENEVGRAHERLRAENGVYAASTPPYSPL